MQLQHPPSSTGRKVEGALSQGSRRVCLRGPLLLNPAGVLALWVLPCCRRAAGGGGCCARAQGVDPYTSVSVSEPAFCALENEIQSIPGSCLSSCVLSVLTDSPGGSKNGTVFPRILRSSELARVDRVIVLSAVSADQLPLSETSTPAAHWEPVQNTTG